MNKLPDDFIELKPFRNPISQDNVLNLLKEGFIKLNKFESGIIDYRLPLKTASLKEFYYPNLGLPKSDNGLDYYTNFILKVLPINKIVNVNYLESLDISRYKFNKLNPSAYVRIKDKELEKLFFSSIGITLN